MAIVALNSPEQLALLQSNVGELAQGLNWDERQQAEMQASMLSQNSGSVDDKDADIEARIHRSRAGKK